MGGEAAIGIVKDTLCYLSPITFGCRVHTQQYNTDAGSKLSLAVEQIKLSIFNTSEAAVKTVSNRFYRLTYGSNGLYGANLRSDSIVKNYLKPPNNVSKK